MRRARRSELMISCRSKSAVRKIDWRDAEHRLGCCRELRQHGFDRDGERFANIDRHGAGGVCGFAIRFDQLPRCRHVLKIFVAVMSAIAIAC